MDSGDRPQARNVPAWTGLAGLCLVLALSLFTVWDVRPPDPLPADAPETGFSAERAREHQEQIARAPHPTGTEEHERVLEYLLGELTGLGLEPEVHDAVGIPAMPVTGNASAARTRNVVAVIEGSDPTGRTVLAAHYDSVPSGPGANDDAAGVASILETARALLASDTPPRNDVVLLLTDAEEVGLLGAEAVMDSHPLGAEDAVFLNLEARGGGGSVLMFRSTEGGAELVRLFADAAPHPVGDSLTAEIFAYFPNDTDFTAFAAGGWAGLDFAYAGESAHYHSVTDTVENADPGSLQQMGANTLALTRALGEEDLAALGSDDNLVYFNVPPGNLVHFPAGWVVPLGALTLALAIGSVALARRGRQLTLPRTLVATAAVVVLLAAVVAVAVPAWPGLVALRGGFALLPTGTPYRPEWFQAGLLLVTLVLVSVWYALLRRWAGAQALFNGAVLTAALLGGALTLVAPGASAVFLLPAAGAAVGGAAAVLVGPGSPWRPVLLTLGALPGAVLLLAGSWISFEAGLEMGAYLALPFALFGLLFLLPLADIVFEDGRVLPVLSVPLVAAATAVAAVLAGLWANPVDDPAQPLPVRLTYTLDADTGQAVWASPVIPGQDPGPLDDWTGQYVDDELADNPTPGLTWPQARVGDADAAPLDPPELEVLGESTADGARTVRLELTAVRGAEILNLVVGDGAERVRSTAVEGRELDLEPDDDGMYGVRFHAPEDGSAEVEMVLDEAGGPLPVLLAEVESLPSALAGVPGYAPPPDHRYLALSWVSVTSSHEI